MLTIAKLKRWSIRRRRSRALTWWRSWVRSCRWTPHSHRAVVEAAVDAVALRLTNVRAAHQREGHERFTLDQILAEEKAVLDLVDAQEPRAMLFCV